MENFQPVYLSLLQSSELRKRVRQAYDHLEACDLCAWECRVNRSAGKMGVCRSGIRARRQNGEITISLQRVGIDHGCV